MFEIGLQILLEVSLVYLCCLRSYTRTHYPQRHLLLTTSIYITADASSSTATKTVNELGPVAVGKPFPTFGGLR